MASFAIRQTTIREGAASTSSLLPPRYPRLSLALLWLRRYANDLYPLGLDPVPSKDDKRVELRHPQRTSYGLDLSVEEVTL